jgi:hypothetical protein
LEAEYDHVGSRSPDERYFAQKTFTAIVRTMGLKETPEDNCS